MFIIRRFKPDDTLEVIQLANELLPEQYDPTIFNFFYETFPDFFLVAEHQQKIIGYLTGILLDQMHGKLLMLAIQHIHQRKGIATALLNQFITELLSQNVSMLDLEVRTNNITAITFYKKHGLKITEKITGFYQNEEDAYSMRKKI